MDNVFFFLRQERATGDDGNDNGGDDIVGEFFTGGYRGR